MTKSLRTPTRPSAPTWGASVREANVETRGLIPALWSQGRGV